MEEVFCYGGRGLTLRESHQLDLAAMVAFCARSTARNCRSTLSNTLPLLASSVLTGRRGRNWTVTVVVAAVAGRAVSTISVKPIEPK